MMPFPWFLSFLICSLILWSMVCAFSSFHLSTLPPTSGSTPVVGMSGGWLATKL